MRVAWLRIAAISIHALRGEGDEAAALYILQSNHFNPRPPWGGRPKQWSFCSRTR